MYANPGVCNLKRNNQCSSNSSFKLHKNAIFYVIYNLFNKMSIDLR